MDADAQVRPRRQELRAVIIRADGTREDAGLVAAAYRSRWRQLWWRLWGRPAAAFRAYRINRAHAARQRQQ